MAGAAQADAAAALETGCVQADSYRLAKTRNQLANTSQYRPPADSMFVYALTQPVDDFDALTPLPDWITADPVPRTHWALQAVLALTDVADHVRWDGDMRHLPSVGAILTPPETHPYLVIKQDNNGTTFVISDIEIPGLTAVIDHTARAIPRPIGTWTHPTSHDIPEIPQPRTTAPTAQPSSDPPF